jgi:hypothetical protein
MPALLANTHTMSITQEKISVEKFWKQVVEGNKTEWLHVVEYILNKFGTALSCNRFAVGEVIEFATKDYMINLGVDAKCVPSATRIDMVCNIEGLDGISSKFVSSRGKDTKGHVVLHNAQRTTATDTTLHPTLLFLLDEWWFLEPKYIKQLGIEVSDHIKNTGDSVQLKFTLLPQLREKNYPYVLKQTISYDKESCPRKATSELTYKILKDLLSPKTDPIIKKYLEDLVMSIQSRRST